MSVRRLLATWGNGDFGRLGLGSECLSELLPKVVPGLADCAVKAVACGSAHTAALGEDGSVYTMGLNDAGQLGHSHDQPHFSEPREVLVPEATVQIAAGARHTLMLGESGDVWAVGSNEFGQLGLGTSAPVDSRWPHRIAALAGARVTSVSAGANHSLAVTHSGEILSWGSGSHGELGHGRAAIPADRNELVPRTILSLQGKRVASAAAGFLHSGCLDESGNLWMWGDNRFWQLGVPIAQQTAEPVRMQVDLPGIRQIALSGHHTLALSYTGRLFTWGANENGVLGLGRESQSTSRQPTMLPRVWFQQVACGWKHCAAVDAHGQLYCWGWGGSEGSSSAIASLASAGGQLGLGNEFDYWMPTKVQQNVNADAVGTAGQGEISSKAIQVACGLNHTAAVIEVPS